MRWPVRLAIYLTASVATTVALAWGAVFFSPIRDQYFANVNWGPIEGDLPGQLAVAEGFGVRYSRLSYVSRDRSIQDYEIQTTLAGWPFMSLSSRIRVAKPRPDVRTFDAPNFDWASGLGIGTVDTPIATPMFRRLPLNPEWSGFSATFGLVLTALLGVVELPVAARRWHRRRNGRCSLCGYPHAVGQRLCPECGNRCPTNLRAFERSA
jgi:hypothetical protein